MKFTLNNKEVELTAEEVQEIVEQSKKPKEKKIEIKHRYTDDVIYSSSKPTLKEAVEEAVKYGVNLLEANLYEANLLEANLHGANLYGADLRDVILRGANLRGAYLGGSDLGGANLYGADLYGADLMYVKFYGKGGSTKINKSQVDNFLTALGVIVEN